MAVTAGIIHYDGFISLNLHPGESKASVADFPDEREWPFDFNYDDEKLARGEREFLGITVLDVSLITDEWLAELDQLDLPRVDVPEIGLYDASIGDVLRWARRTYPSRYTGVRA